MKKIDWDNEPLLGKVPDPVLAEKYDVEITTVFLVRKRRGISACPHIFKLPRDVSLDGSPKELKELAKKYKVSIKTVYRERIRRRKRK